MMAGIRMLWIISMSLNADDSVFRIGVGRIGCIAITNFTSNHLNRVGQAFQDRAGSPPKSVLRGGISHEQSDEKSRENDSRVHDRT
jgi:hypothetical protein